MLPLSLPISPFAFARTVRALSLTVRIHSDLEQLFGKVCVCFSHAYPVERNVSNPPSCSTTFPSFRFVVPVDAVDNTMRLFRQVYTYHKDTLEPPVALGVLRDHVDLSNESPSTLIIKNTTIEMQGTYTCNVMTAKGKSQNDAFLIVIVDACKESSWETTTDMVGCIEDVTFYCRGMFPKPAPVCGIYNDATGSYVQSVTFDRVEKMEDGTYEISLFRRLHARDWLKQAGQLSFRCFMIVMSTTWRKGIHHRLFGEAGCVQPPPNVNNGYYNMTAAEETCWRTPREGSKLKYSCHRGFDLLGPESYVCRNGTWKAVPSTIARRNDKPAVPVTNTSIKVFTRRIVPKGHQITVCNGATHSIWDFANPVILLTALSTIASSYFR